MDYVYHITTGITQNSHDWLVFCSFVVVVFTQMPNIRPAVMCGSSVFVFFFFFQVHQL
jgi:hypothetical protein